MGIVFLLAFICMSGFSPAIADKTQFKTYVIHVKHPNNEEVAEAQNLESWYKSFMPTSMTADSDQQPRIDPTLERVSLSEYWTQEYYQTMFHLAMRECHLHLRNGKGSVNSKGRPAITSSLVLEILTARLRLTRPLRMAPWILTVAASTMDRSIKAMSAAPEITSFSSRGPSLASPGILKPDITGPGVSVLAAWPSSVDNRTDSKPADVFAVGAGHVNPSRANDPGLIYDIQPNDYIPYLCGLGYNDTQVRAIIRHKVQCSKESSIPEAQLNYPSFSVAMGSSALKLQRTVTNVGEAKASYIVKISAPQGVDVSVKPRKLDFTQTNQKKTYTVTFERKDDGKTGSKPFAQGFLEWVSAKHSVRSPISVKFE
ncbi:unnamed protein product, partial [Vitis vinifera]